MKKIKNLKVLIEKGFSLIEILVVLMIIGLLTAVVAINVLPSQDRARVDKATADIRIMEQALELYRLEYSDLNQLLSGEFGAKGPFGPLAPMIVPFAN